MSHSNKCEILVEDFMTKTKDRKSHKKSHKKSNKDSSEDACNVNCCVSDCNPDCCTAAFQRLDKLRELWLESQLKESPPDSVNTRDSKSVAVNINIPGVSPNTAYRVLEQTAAGFVNTVRYLNFEECGKLDQVTGWSVNVSTGNLYFYQDLPELGLDKTTSRAALLGKASNVITHAEKKQLTEMQPFWKLSLKAIERVNENPKTEGNICEVRDKCGNKFLIAINRTDSQENISICDYNSSYSIVAVKLC